MKKNNQHYYRILCEENQSIPVFSKAWWLDSEFGEENWNVALVFEDNKIIASMPFQIPNGIFKKSVMPQFAQTIGPWIDKKIFENTKYKISKEFDILNKLINNLPKTGYFLQQFHRNISNHSPFFWKGFSQQTKYSYLIKDISNIEKVIDSFHSSKKRGLKIATEILKLDLNYSGEEFFDDYNSFLGKQNIQYSKEYFIKIYNSSIINNSGKIFCAKDSNGNVHGSLFIVWDKESAYHLVTPINPKFRHSYSLTFLIIEALKFLQGKVKYYDFEGSMIPNIEKTFREYGGVPVAYHRIKKVDNLLLKLLFFTRSIFKND